jgi:endoglucanase
VLLLAGALLVPTLNAVQNPIRLNSLGFLPDQAKQASVVPGGANFTVLRAAGGEVVFQGPLTGPLTNADTEEVLFTADFSVLCETGKYQLEVPGVGRSPVFAIGPEVYREPYVAAMRAFYLWRCGTAVKVHHAGQVYGHGACHTNDAWLDFITGRHESKPSVGGWHDAGDYNKYVVNAGVTVGTLLRAWEDFGGRLEKIPLGVPEAGGLLPEFLAEMRWELDWLFTMQTTNGAVYHKVSTVDFGPFLKPEEEHEPRYFAPCSSEATANFVGMMAAASRTFQPYDPSYAEKCLQAAGRSYAWLTAHPARQKSDQSKFATGAYDVADEGARLWAATELWAATGRDDCLRDAEARLREMDTAIPRRWDYGNPAPLGCLTYQGTSHPGRDESLVTLLRSNLVVRADQIVAATAAHGYARPNLVGYGWGYNGQVARQAVLLYAAHQVSPRPEYRQTACDAVGYLFGRNVHGRSYVTGFGHQPPMHPHDRGSASDGVPGPWPGFLVGGPHPRPTDWFDVQEDYRTNEIAINWNSALVYALAWLMGGTR